MTPDVLHIGRSWTSTDVEDACPCPKVPCGLVSSSDIDPACPEHPAELSKSMRRIHQGSACPGPRRART